jgi:hypothetical protein
MTFEFLEDFRNDVVGIQYRVRTIQQDLVAAIVIEFLTHLLPIQVVTLSSFTQTPLVF